MNIGIVGLPNSGKTTVFNALTGQEAATAAYTGSGEETNVAAVKVPDPRLDFLFDMYLPRNKKQVELKFTDFAPVKKGGGGFSDKHIGDLRNCDALLLVVRAFEDEGVSHPDGKVDAAADCETLLMEFALADLEVVEKRLNRIRDSYIKMPKEEKAKADKEKPVLERFKEVLEAGGSAAGVEVEGEAEKLIRSYGLLSRKPALVILNVSEEQYGKNASPALAEKTAGAPVLELAGKLEMEISRLEEEERKMFLEDAGIAEPAAARVIRAAYLLTGMITYLTAGGKDEVAAWQIKRGDNAQAAAAKIHSDIARGFIRAEVVAFDDIKKHGDMNAVKEAGKFRLEGKDYIVQDGDIITFRFNV